MGNDGGSIPTRRELVKSTKGERTSSELFEQNLLNATFVWSTCLLSKRPLELPVVSDYLGHLYNKDSILEWLISPENFGDGEAIVPHIKSLKDIVELKITKDETSGKWTCPVTGKELKAGGSKFDYLPECGHVFAESAFREIDTDNCLECGLKYNKDNVVTINPTTKSDVEANKARMERLINGGLTHSLKSASNKKRRKNGEDANEKKGKKKSKAGESIHNEETLRMTKKVLESVQHDMNSRKRSEAIQDLYLKA
ncbi:Rtf2 RING-finger-domain-containing protein [Lipomyces doorenjongii]|uniref:Rtf2 RING-finger-domain-containing protein n=1 Tax=Lipomyces doorenjongii TaxID=383834 RepID=UPI003343EA2C